jgi:hypothetical protein
MLQRMTFCPSSTRRLCSRLLKLPTNQFWISTLSDRTFLSSSFRTALGDSIFFLVHRQHCSKLPLQLVRYCRAMVFRGLAKPALCLLPVSSWRRRPARLARCVTSALRSRRPLFSCGPPRIPHGFGAHDASRSCCLHLSYGTFIATRVNYEWAWGPRVEPPIAGRDGGAFSSFSTASRRVPRSPPPELSLPPESGRRPPAW